MSAFAVGVDHAKFEVNVGTLMRSAYNLGAALVFTVGRRYEPSKAPGDVLKAYRHIPLLHFATWEDVRGRLPFGWVPVGVEIGPMAQDLRDYKHPREAVYILGAEDHGLTKEAAALCRDIVAIPSRLCMNVAVAGSIVMYDRALKKARPL